MHIIFKIWWNTASLWCSKFSCCLAYPHLHILYQESWLFCFLLVYLLIYLRFFKFERQSYSFRERSSTHWFTPKMARPEPGWSHILGLHPSVTHQYRNSRTFETSSSLFPAMLAGSYIKRSIQELSKLVCACMQCHKAGPIYTAFDIASFC